MTLSTRLRDSRYGKYRIGICSRKIKNFLTIKIQSGYRVGNVSNFRKVKRDALTTLQNRLLENVLLDKKDITARNPSGIWYVTKM